MLEVMMSSLFIVVLFNWPLIMNMMMLHVLMLLLLLFDSSIYNLQIIMVILTFWLIIMLMMSVNKNDYSNELLLMILGLLGSLQIVFMSDSLMIFYLSFEMTVLPMLLIIFGWGYQPDRVEAGMYMLCYTVVFSLPLLIGIFFLENNLGFSNFFMFLILVMAFLVKFPMFGLHMWLPRAHVEAPLFGSMILAGIMLKLGGYGLIKISFFVGDLIYMWSSGLIIFSVMGGLLLSLICFIQSDMKLLVAYSSIVHMSIIIGGIFTMNYISLQGSIFMMVGHGLCSSGLFCVLGLTYNRIHSRSFFMNKGLLNIVPIMSLWWFMFCSSNLSFPPCLNLISEILLFSSIVMWSNLMTIVLIMLGFFSSMYSIYLFSFSQHGSYITTFSFKCFSLKESLLMILHWLPLNIFMLDLSFFMM